MLLKNLFENDCCDKNVLKKIENFDVKNITKDCENISKNCVYFCLTDEKIKAQKRCEIALQNGADLIFSNFDFDSEKHIKLSSCRKAFSACCANFYDHACDKMKIVGITGTNGKTSICSIVNQILSQNNVKVGVIGTNGVFYDGKEFPCPLTTPDADFLHKTFFDMHKAGVEVVVMEVSAHAVVQNRIDDITFEVGVLSNITQDHLDYFKTMENYQKAKLDFIKRDRVLHKIACIDDERIFKNLDFEKFNVLSYGVKNPADIFAIDTKYSLLGTTFVANVNDEIVISKNKLVGLWNVYNSLAALAVCQVLGLDSKQLESGICAVTPIDGRFNVLTVLGRSVIIDFAHSPDSLKNVLLTVKNLCKGRVFLVFGCGGNRDKTKRIEMGKVAQEFADVVCLTDDNPRFENEMQIISDIEKGLTKPHYVELDRQKAIEKMIKLSSAADFVLVAGKGAEKYQEKDGKKIFYNDFDAVLKISKSRLKNLKNNDQNFSQNQE